MGFLRINEGASGMATWLAELDRQLLGDRRELLANKGCVSHKQAVEKAEQEFETYRAREMKQMESDFDRVVKALGADGRGEVGTNCYRLKKEAVGGLNFMACIPQNRAIAGLTAPIAAKLLVARVQMLREDKSV
jgi:hypothetical protein